MHREALAQKPMFIEVLFILMKNGEQLKYSNVSWKNMDKLMHKLVNSKNCLFLGDYNECLTSNKASEMNL
jgi:hypothetical protein